MSVGSSHWGDQQAHAVIDEFRISDLPRVGSGGGFPYRILVADSGNHRLQAFDDLGDFVTAYGSPGSGPGQFNNPQGLAASEDGRVVVADRDNHRLQVLSFDGTDFDFQQIITAGLQAPVGVALYGADRILVADTGNNRVVVLDGDGSLVAEYTEPNDGYTGPFNQPWGLFGEAGGDIVVADTGNQRVVSILGALPSPEYAAVLPLVLKNVVPSPPTCEELIENGGFEDDTAWLIGQTPRPARYTTERAHSGGRSVLLGLKPGEEDLLSYSSVQQTMTLPPGAHWVSLNFWVALLSDLDEGDRQECLLLDAEGDWLEVVMRGNADAADWASVSYDLSAYAGQTVTLYFNSFNDGDGGGVAGFYLDDVSVEACSLNGARTELAR
jgi:hypothetical protein